MAFDIVVFDDNYRFAEQLHLDAATHGILFRKLVTTADYPNLGRLKDDKEDVIFQPDEAPALRADVLKLDGYLNEETLMAPEIKARCRAFVDKMKGICAAAEKAGKSVDCIAGE